MFWFVFVRFGIGVCLTWILYDFVPGFGCNWCLLFSIRACWRYIGHSVVDPGVRIYHESMRPQVPKFTVVYINQIDSGVLYYLIICTSHQQVGEQDFHVKFWSCELMISVVTPIFEPLLGPVCLLQTVTPTCVASHYIHVGASLAAQISCKVFLLLPLLVGGNVAVLGSQLYHVSVKGLLVHVRNDAQASGASSLRRPVFVVSNMLHWLHEEGLKRLRG